MVRAQSTRCFIFFLLFFLANVARGQMTVRATFGWGNSLRLGWWTPVYVTVRSPITQSILLEVRGQHGLSTGFVVRQHAVAQPEATVYEVLFPIDADPSKIIVSALDESTGKTLGWQQLEDPIFLTNSGMPPHHLLGGGAPLIGVSSGNGAAAELRHQWETASLSGGFLPPLRLPANSVGYLGIRVLMLDSINLNDLTSTQERAILDRVSAGGNLLFWPGIDPLPQRDEILFALPCQIGKDIPVSLKDLGTLNGRELSPQPNATELPIFSGGPSAYTAPYGLGRITVLPADLSNLPWKGPAAARPFWRTVLTGMVQFSEPKPPQEVSEAQEDIDPAAHPRLDDIGGRRTIAMRQLLSQWKAPPDALHDWGSILLLLAAMMFIAGPLDSVLLYRLGRPPRSWITSIGWFGLILMLGLYAFTRPRTSPPMVQTFRLIDQIDDATIGQTDLVRMTSSVAQSRDLALDESEWWEPARPNEQPGDQFTEVVCRQDRQGSQPARVSLQPGRPILLLGEKIAPGRKIVTANLSVKNVAGKPHLVGAIANDSSSTLNNIRFSADSAGCAVAGKIDPGTSIQVDEILLAKAPGDASDNLWDIAPQRTDRIDALLGRGGQVRITAESSEPTNVIQGVDAAEHRQLVRIVTPLH